jgi:hypothetical protein
VVAINTIVSPGPAMGLSTLHSFICYRDGVVIHSFNSMHTDSMKDVELKIHWKIKIIT